MKQRAHKTTLLARTLIAGVLLWTTIYHLSCFDETTRWVTKYPTFVVRLVIGGEKLLFLKIIQAGLLGGLLLGASAMLVGFYPRHAAFLLIVLLITIVLCLGNFVGGTIGTFQGQALGLIGGLLLILAHDPGPPILNKGKRR